MSKHILYLGLDPSHYSSVDRIVTHWPIIQIIPRPLSDKVIYQALKNFTSYSHIVVTSKTTVAILKDYLPQIGIHLNRWAEKATLAVGKVTAQHLETCGITPIRVAKEETAEGIVDELKQLPLKDAHVFWPHAEQARGIIPQFLIKNHIRHTTCILYHSQPHQPGPLPHLESFDEIVFTSPSTVTAFLKIFGTFPHGIQFVTIGPITARYLKECKKKL